MMQYKYYAFISHASADEKMARWLERKLTAYRIPVRYVEELKGEANAGPVPKRMSIARSAAEADKTPNISELAHCLIIICSPDAARSEAVEKHARCFTEAGREGRIIPFVVDGAPIGENGIRCYPVSLSPDILGITLSDGTKEEALMKIVARMLEVKYSRLYQRHLRERRRATRRALAAACAVFVLVAALAFKAVSTEMTSARRRNESESLARFLITELRGEENIPEEIRRGINEKAGEFLRD